MSDNVININEVKPKSVITQYKHVKIKLTYLPKDQRWRWDIKVVTETNYGEVSTDQNRALKEAQKYIDKNKLGTQS